MKTIIAILATMVVALVLWSHIQAKTITQTRKTLANVRRNLTCSKQERERLVVLCKRQIKEISHLNAKLGSVWEGPGWYKYRVLHYGGSDLNVYLGASTDFYYKNKGEFCKKLKLDPFNSLFFSCIAGPLANKN